MNGTVGPKWVEVPVGPEAPRGASIVVYGHTDRGASIVVYGHTDREAAMDLCGQLLMPGFAADGRSVQGPTAVNVWSGEDAAWEEIAALPAPVSLPWSPMALMGVAGDLDPPYFQTAAEWAAAMRRALDAGDMLRAGARTGEPSMGEPNAMSLLLEGRLRRAMAREMDGGNLSSYGDVAVMPGFQQLLRVRREGDSLETPEGNPGEALEYDEGSRWPYPGDKWMYREDIEYFEETGIDPRDDPVWF